MNKNSSAKINKELALSKNPPYRRYFCHYCHHEVKICILCDHGHKYCPACKKESKHNKNKKSNAKYRLTLKGKKTRAACESRRREKLKENLNNSESYKIMGDPPTNIAKVLPNVEKAVEVAVMDKKNIKIGEEKNNDNFFEIQNLQSNALRFSPTRGECEEIFCAYCFRECSNYSYDKLLSKRIYKQRYWKTKKTFSNKRGEV